MKTYLLFIFSVLISVASSAQIRTSFDVQVSGKGRQAIIFIPGFACAGEVWRETRSDFENDFTCYTLTMPGFAGVSAAENPSFHSWEKQIADFIIEKKISQPILIGHSMGGGIALAIAADYPQLISKIVVVDALPCLAAVMNPDYKVKENNDCGVIIHQMEVQTEDQFRQMQKMTAMQLVTDTARQNLVVNWSLLSDRKTMGAMFCDFMNTDLRMKISNIKCPAMILLEANFAGIKTNIEDQYKNLKTADLRYASKGLHFIMYDDTDWYNKQLNSFIRQ